jgi:Plavaka transposase
MAALHTHCRRDLFHACWKHLLDADFLEAYRHGIVLQCPDGILRRVFPRIFTYSADYPEKCARFLSHCLNINQCCRVLIATIKDMGSCPCPRCLAPKASFDLMGLFKDIQGRVANIRTYCLDNVTRARGFIYGLGHTVDGSKVQVTLGEGSWVPTMVSAFGINCFR